MSTGVDVFMPIYIGDYTKDTKGLTTEQHGAYLLLLLDMWNRGGYLPEDHDELAIIAFASADRWPKIWAKIERFFMITPKGITQKRLLVELDAAIERRRLKSTAGRAGADARWGQPSGPNGGGNGRSDATAMADGIADASQTAWQTDSLQSSSSPSNTKTPTRATPPSTTSRARTREGSHLAVVPEPEDDVGVAERQALAVAICRVRKLDPTQLSPGEWDKTAELVAWCFEREVTDDDVGVWGEECWEVLRARLGRKKITAPTCSQLGEHFASKLVEEGEHENEEAVYAAVVER